MINPGEVLSMLCPGVELAIVGDKYEDIDWFGKEPAITKKQYEDGFAQVEAWQAERLAAKSAAAASAVTKLEAIGLTAEEIAALRG